jgi:hypothetical protein
VTTVATTPTYAVPSREARVVFTLAGSGANFVRVWCTVAPTGSKFANDLAADTTLNRTVAYEGDGGANDPWMWTPDVGGKYTFVAQEYTLGSSYGGGYTGSVEAAPSETKVGAEATLYLYVGQRMKQAIGVAPNTAELVLWVWDATIRPTTLATHGEKTPAIAAENPSAAARTAMEAAAVTAALAAIENVAAATALGPVGPVIADIGYNYNQHRVSVSHPIPDSHNALAEDYYNVAPAPGHLTEFVNSQALALRMHMLNDVGSGTATSAFHATADMLNLPAVLSAGSIDDAYPALAELWRSYEAHRVSTPVHTTADTTWTLSPLPPILAAHAAYLAQLAAISPTAPPAAQAGAVLLAQQAGFQEG